jgi:hypothetical protein
MARTESAGPHKIGERDRAGTVERHCGNLTALFDTATFGDESATLFGDFPGTDDGR